VEEQFYLVWPFVVLLTRPHRLARLCLALVGASLLLRLGALALPHGEAAAYVLTPMRLDGLALGGWLAVVMRRPEAARQLRRLAPGLMLAGASCMLAIAMMTRRLDAHDAITWTLGFTGVDVFFAGLLACIVGVPDGRVARAFTTRPLRVLGKYSYALYVFHYPLLYFVGPERLRPLVPTAAGSEVPAQVVFTLAILGLSLGGAWVSWHLFERHILGLKDVLAPVPRRHAPPVAPELATSCASPPHGGKPTTRGAAVASSTTHRSHPRTSSLEAREPTGAIQVTRRRRWFRSPDHSASDPGRRSP
jgi:peptidoglycan/LPS O-acetylase OafA/YrhL